MDFFSALLSKLILFVTSVLVALATLLTSPPETVVVEHPSQPQESTVATTPPTATSTQVKPAQTPNKERAVVPIAKPVSKPPPPAPNLGPAIDPNILNTQTRAALVNILCTTKYGGYFKPISGSGVIVDTRGVVLTNAHVGQFFLLRDYLIEGNVDCVIRSGSPARTVYRAELLYLPPAWIEENASQIAEEQATGTGEHDYAFLRITEPTGPSVPLPTAFPALVMTGATPQPNEQMLLAAYPAGFLDGQMIAINLYISSAYARVAELFTFNNPEHVDLFAIGGTVVSQSGSSGGAVVRVQDAKLAGLIVTSSAADTTAERDLRAITMGHIDRSLAQEGAGGLVEFLSQDLAAQARAFASTTAPLERQTLIQAIEER